MLEKIVRDALIIWATVDPIGTMALFLSVTVPVPKENRTRLALRATIYSTLILVGCIILGQIIMDAMGISMGALQIAGGIILFLFGIQMVFGSAEKHPARESDSPHDLAVFPLAVPSIASPGAIMSVILLTDNDRFTLGEQAMTTLVLLGVLALTFLLMYFAGPIHRVLGLNGAAILTRVMGMLLAAMAVEMVMDGMTEEILRHSNNAAAPEVRTE